MREWKKKSAWPASLASAKPAWYAALFDSMFDERYLTTIGVKIDRKDVVVGSDSVTLMLWDLAGEDDLAQLKVSHLRGASGYILVADGCRASSLAKAVELQQRIADQLGPLPFVLVLNKADLRDRWEFQSAAVSGTRLAHF